MRGVRSLMLSLAGLITAGLSLGCVSSEILAEKNMQIERLQEESSKNEDALRQSQTEVYSLKEDLKALTAEKENQVKDNDRLNDEIRSLNDKIVETNKKSVQSSSRVVESERAYEKLKQTLNDVQGEASRLAEELSDHRIKLREMEQRYAEIEKANGFLRKDGRELALELSSARDELKRQKVMIDVLKKSAEQGKSVDTELVAQLRSEIRNLEEAGKAHKKERVSLHKQIEEMRSLLPEGAATEIIKASDKGRIYTDDPGGLTAELQTFLAGRFGKMTSGESAWDAYDIGLTVGASVFLLALIWLFWIPMRWKKRKALKMELRHMRERLQTAGQRDSSQNRVRRNRERQGSIVRRSGQFSPILGTEEEYEGEEDVGELSEANQEGLMASLTATVAPPETSPSELSFDPPQSGGAARGSQIIGAHQWDETSEAEEDDFGNTQIIPDVSELELQRTPGSEPRDPLSQMPRAPSPPSPSPESLVDDEEEEDEFAHTQIIPSLDGVGPDLPLDELPATAPTSEEKKKEESSSSQDLMTELEDLIGKKVDELIQ